MHLLSVFFSRNSANWLLLAFITTAFGLVTAPAVRASPGVSDSVPASTKPQAEGNTSTDNLIRHIRLDVRPDVVKERQEWQFNKDGKGPTLNTRIIVDLVATPPTHIKILSKSVFIDKAITGDGRSLSITQDTDRFRPIATNADEMWSFGFAAYDSWVVRKLRLIHGSMTLQIATGDLKTLQSDLAPIGKYLDKRVQLPGLNADMWVKITRSKFIHKAKHRTIRRGDWLSGEMMPANRRDVRIVFSDRAYRTLDHVLFTSKNGSPLKMARQEESRPRPRDNTVTFFVNLPGDGRVSFQFWKHVKRVDVPFTLKDVPTPASSSVKKAVMSLPAR